MPTFGTTESPRHTYAISSTYRASGGWKAMLLLFSVIALVFGAIGVWCGTAHHTASNTGDVVLATVSLVFLILGGYVGVWIARFRIILHSDSIEIHDIVRVRLLQHDQLAGWRMIRNTTPPMMIFERKDGGRHIKLARIFRIDDNFTRWMSALPNLDAQNRVSSQQELTSDEGLGSTPAERLERVATARLWAKALIVLTFVVVGWGWLYPSPYGLVIAALMLLPWLAIALVRTFGGAIRIDDKKNDIRPGVGIAVLGPGLILALRATTDMNVLDWQYALAFAVGVALMLSAGAALADGTVRQKPWTALLILVLNVSYGYGAVMEANALLDHAPTTVYSATVSSKRISHGRHADFYKLELGPWGPKTNDNVSVSSRFYESVNPGDDVCLHVRPGAFHIAWYVVRLCQ